MITESSIYWITRMDYLHCLGILISGLGILGVVLSVGAARNFESEGNEKTAKLALFRLAPFSALIAIAGILGIVFIPTTKEMAMIKIIPALTNSELIQKTIPAEAKEIYALAKYALTQTIKEAK